MRIENIRSKLDEIQGFWGLLEDSFDQIGFSERYVQHFLAVNTLGPSKYFKDSIWGMMEFTPDEIALIDSPILQRLRRIYQLGFTYLTYSSAEHSRFSHTLGVSSVVKQLVASIAKGTRRNNSLKAQGEEYPFYDPTRESERETIRSLYHAALLHDCGHVAYSHAGETAFLSNSDVARVGGISIDDFLYLFREQGFDSALSECVSIAICLSPRFRAFYGKIIGSTDVDRRISDVCALIGGIPHDPSYPGLANIISGAAVDADKIDYLNRDAKECGIPVGVDISRVFLNTAIIKIEERQANKLSRTRVNEVGATHRFVPGWHFIVNSTGLDTYDELANAKSVLYNRVYLHQLTRNAERFLAAIVREGCLLDGSIPTKDLFYWFRFGDETFLQKLVNLCGNESNANRLAMRQLPKRAFVLFREVCSPYASMSDLFSSHAWSKPENASYLDELNANFVRQTAWKLYDRILPSDPQEAPLTVLRLTDEIRREAVKVRQSLLAKVSVPELKLNEPYIGFSPRHISKPVPEVLVREKNAIGFSSNWSKSEELTIADNVARGVDYFYADAEWRVCVAIACTKVLYSFNSDRLGVAPLIDEGDAKAGYEGAKIKLIPRLTLNLQVISNRIGFDYDNLIEQMKSAALAGYFDKYERLVPLGPAEQRLSEAIARKYSHMEGERGWRVTERLVELFTRQFPVVLRSELLSVLEQGVLIDRSTIRNAFDTLFKERQDDLEKGVIICRFSPNSGNFTGMILEQERLADYKALGYKFARSIAELEAELMKSPEAMVVFVDDQFATGGQAHAQLLQWAGKVREEWPEALQSEQNIEKTVLSEKTKACFSSGRVVLSFLYGTVEGKDRILEAAKQVGFANVDVQYLVALELIRPELSSDLKKFLSSVGFELLRRVRHGEADLTEQQSQNLIKDSLGYDAKATVLMTPFGAPSHALTALWCPGIYNGEAWIPLFLRRGYRKHLVLS